MTSAPDPNAVNSVLYALSTLAQTCAALAALVGALALYRLQAMREDRRSVGGAIQHIVATELGGQFGSHPTLENALHVARQNLTGAATRVFSERGLENLRVSVAEWDRFPDRYKSAVTVFVLFEVWNLAAILASLLGFACVIWLVDWWRLFVTLLVVVSVGTVGVTGAALYGMAKRDSVQTSTDQARPPR